MHKILKETEMKESEGIQRIVNQVAVWAAALMMELRDADVRPQPATIASLR